jgi:hypothetical protein
VTTPETFTGGCHCGAVRWRVAVRERVALACNCSICTKKGFLHVIVPTADFELLTEPAALATYRFNTGVAQHLFCRTCGTQSHYIPRSHPDGVSTNLRCFEDAAARASFEVRPFDGRNWEQNIEDIAGY